MPKRPKPDTRPSWRDPDLPCIRLYKFANGVVKHEVDPDYERRYREYMITNADNPSWKNDPTYNLRRRK